MVEKIEKETVTLVYHNFQPNIGVLNIKHISVVLGVFK